MALSDCYMVRDIQDFFGEQMLNVYFYQDLLLASTAENVVDSFVADVLPKVLDIQNGSIKHVLVDAVNLGDPGNFYEEIHDDVGTYSGDMLPPFNAINYSLRLNSRLLRPGSKRYAGVNESVQINGLLTDATYLTKVEALRVQQSAILLSGVLSTFQPIVVKRVKYNPDPLDETHFAYRLPQTDEEFVFGNVIDALTTTHVSHQVSRKVG